MEYKGIIYEKKGNVGIVTINRSKVLNAMDTPTVNEIRDCFQKMAEDNDIRCVIMTGTGKSFCSGGDIYEEEGLTVIGFNYFIANGQEFVESMETFKCPVIAAINGWALGGGLEFALACDFRIAAESAKVGFPEVLLGVIPGWGGTQRASRLCGPAWARRLVCSGEKITAQKAMEIGLIEEVVPDDKLMETAMALAEKIADNPPIAVEFGKQAVNSGLFLDVHRGMELERGLICQLKTTEDNAEGYAAFLEKRPHKPFQGK